MNCLLLMTVRCTLYVTRIKYKNRREDLNIYITYIPLLKTFSQRCVYKYIYFYLPHVKGLRHPVTFLILFRTVLHNMTIAAHCETGNVTKSSCQFRSTNLQVPGSNTAGAYRFCSLNSQSCYHSHFYLKSCFACFLLFLL